MPSACDCVTTPSSGRPNFPVPGTAYGWLGCSVLSDGGGRLRLCRGLEASPALWRSRETSTLQEVFFKHRLSSRTGSERGVVNEAREAALVQR